MFPQLCHFQGQILKSLSTSKLFQKQPNFTKNLTVSTWSKIFYLLCENSICAVLQSKVLAWKVMILLTLISTIFCDLIDLSKSQCPENDQLSRENCEKSCAEKFQNCLTSFSTEKECYESNTLCIDGEFGWEVMFVTHKGVPLLEPGSTLKDEILTIRFATLENPEIFDGTSGTKRT